MDTSKFKKLNEDPTLKREASLQHFLHKLKKKNFFSETEYDKLYPSDSAPARIYGTPKMHKFLSMVLLKCTNSLLVIHFLNFVRLFHLYVLLIIILPVSFVIFFHHKFLMITLAKILLPVVSHIKNANLFKINLVSYDVTSLFTNIPL